MSHHVSLTITLFKIAADSTAIMLALWLAYVLRFDGHAPPYHQDAGRLLLLVLIPTRLASHGIVTRYRLHWRFTSLTDGWFILQSCVLGTALFWTLVVLLPLPMIPRGVLLLEALLTLQFTAMLRVSARLVWNRRAAARSTGTSRRVLVVGAGDGGRRVVRDMKEDRAANLLPVGFVDDDPSKRDRMIHGIRVLGTLQSLSSLVTRHRVDQVLIAIPSLSSHGLTSLIQRCAGIKAELTILPSLPEMLTSARTTGHIRKVKVEDLLERTLVRVDMEEIADYTTGERVLVTGAGGSIGSELCRQIAGLNPEALFILGQGENSIFWIERELRGDYGPRAIPVIADIKDRVRLEKVFRDHRPTVVFHAAAHKHVPLMEQNPEEAIKNNVFGTRNLAELAIEHGVKRFVMISTDKAVNPTSVMGASKRVAEMVVQSLAQRTKAMRQGDADAAMRHLNQIHSENPQTRFAAVRFGNVLGSRGSVIPSMQKQIEKGGPVTVTHPEMVRFFMTIPEAVQLVIQAGAMAKDGEVFVLDMGKPVKIMDLARNLIRLSGFTPERDIKIEVTGIRPGEKLYEEVLTAEEGTTTTAHEKIFVARASRVDHEALHEALDRLEMLAQRGDGNAIRNALKDIVPTFQGTTGAGRPLLPPTSQVAKAAASLSVADLLDEENTPDPDTLTIPSSH